MMFKLQLVGAFTVLSFAASSLGAVSPLRVIEKFEGETTGRYIVKLKDSVSKSPFLDTARRSGGAKITHDWQLFNAFAGEFNTDAINKLRASDDVEYITEDGIMYTLATQNNAPWGLGRTSSNIKLTGSASSLTYTYTYPDSAGAGVNVYVVDTGSRTTHTQFGGRARWGATFGGYANADGHGHGTHCAGTVAGSQFGVAKACNIVAVKVLSDGGSGSVADIVNGLNWVATDTQSSGKPAVVSMSLGGSANTAMDNAVASLTSKGIHVVVAAGNSNADAAGFSPARAPSAITVAASTIADAKASFSNYGSLVDIWAPGQDVISAWSTSDTATNSISGTSMATPHVAGAVCALIARDGNVTPAAMEAKLKSLCLKNVLTGIPSGTTNCLLHI